jgi:hypothetical protein
LGAETDLTAGDLRWLSPLPLWTGILAGPCAFAFDLTVSYALVQWTCVSQRQVVLHLITPATLAVVTGGAMVSWVALQRTESGAPTDGGDPRQRARFMALLGLASSALFAVAILAIGVPRWVLDACH